MNSRSATLAGPYVRQLGFGLLLLALPACGLSDYEARMSEAQKRGERFQEEQKYLDQPLEMPKRKDKEGREEPLANVFFRPPRGIESKPKPEPRSNLMWQYGAHSGSNNFAWVELAFPEDDKDFADKVVNSYQAAEQPTRGKRSVTPPGQQTALVFDTWQFNDAQYGYSINILQSNRPIAIVYIYNKTVAAPVTKAIEISLQSLAIDQQAVAARQRYRQKSPWRLEKPEGSKQ